MTSMKSFLGLVVIACAIGCGIEAPEGAETTGETEQAVKACDDPFNCVRSNGGGVYTQELGNAGMGPDNFMITHFVNSGVSVSVQGRGFDATSGKYVAGTAEIVAARLDATVGALPAGNYHIVSVAETLTVPTFVLSNGTVTGPVTGLDLLDLSIEFKLSGGYATISFAGHSIAKRNTSGTHQTATLQLFDVQWNSGLSVNKVTRQSYCTLAPIGTDKLGKPDNAVFQQGIIVNPLTAELAQNNNYVTLSCRKGAIATVRLWGYAYRGNAAQANAFETAMHMKRASYCGDESFYTLPNTDIFIADSGPVNNDNDDAGNPAITSPDSDFEASWGLDQTGAFRALCVNLAYLRHSAATYPPPQWGGGSPFDGHCANNAPSIPVNNCPAPPTGVPWWFADQADPPSL